jgi:hypothetical protein
LMTYVIALAISQLAVPERWTGPESCRIKALREDQSCGEK